MRIDKHARNLLRLQSGSFYLLFGALIALIAYLSHQHTVQWDWTANQRNTLSATSMHLLKTLDKPLSFTVYATEKNNVRTSIADLIGRYQRAYAKTEVQWINPELEPALARELDINEDGVVMIRYGERSERLTQPNEQAYSNAIQRMARSEERWLVFLSGHGERNPLGEANFDLGEWGKQLKAKGIKLQPLNLTEQPHIPDNAAALVIASPQVDLLPGEVQIISDYVKKGGNLLWLQEPGSLHQLQPLADQLGIQMLPGTIVDANTRLFGISDPGIALVSQYPQHALTQNFDMLTLFPQARALFANNSVSGSNTDRNDAAKDKGPHWENKPFLMTLPRSWMETGPLNGEITFDKDKDVKGPLVIGLTLTRKFSEPQDKPDNRENEPKAGKQQRVVVIGDGDFLSNTYLGNGGNMDLGLHIANWLTHDDQLINIPAKRANDVNLQLSKNAQLIIAFGFLFVIPLALAAGGFGIWWQRRKR